MSPSIALPVGINAVALLAVLIVFGFTISRVVATVPEISLKKVPTGAQEIHKSYAGILSWINAESVRVTDAMGVTHTIPFHAQTEIYFDQSPTVRRSYHDLRVLDHVRIQTTKNSEGEYANFILDIR